MKKLISYFLILLSIFFVVPATINAEELGRVIGDFVSVRNRASSASGTAITKLIYGTTVTIIGEEGSYYKVNYDGKNTGYMSKTYVKKKSDITLDDKAYCDELVSKGFKESYCPYLSYLHKNHPNWSFTPLVTKLDFYKDVVDGEEGKNCIQSTNDVYRSGTKLCDAGGFYFVNQMVNAYMLDPRNFLMDKTIFMFEDLGYTERSQNKDIVSDIFGSSSFLNSTTDNGASYIDYYVDAGRVNKVSPIHLAARTRQEGASKITYGPVSGNVTATLEEYGNRTLKGYYNFYNIGANNGGNPQLKALAYAAGYKGKTDLSTSYGRPWNSRRKAIYGGAQFIANSYIGKGQQTLYFQKFNTNPGATNPLYTHQYMSNIFAPYSEGCEVKKSYEDNKNLDLAHNFYIPVYENMPVETFQPSLLSGNNVLNNIYINDTAIPDFDSDITEYTLYYLDTVTKFTVSAQATSVDSTLSGIGEYEFLEEKNQVIIKVTAENGDVREYIINIIRVKDTTTIEEIIAKLGVKINGNNLYGIATNTAISTIISSVNKISPTATAHVLDKDGNVIKDGNLVTGNYLTIKTLTSGEKKFNIAVNGDLNGDGVVTIQDLLKIQKHLLGTSKLGGIQGFAADTNGDSKIDGKDLLRIQKHILGSITL